MNLPEIAPRERLSDSRRLLPCAIAFGLVAAAASAGVNTWTSSGPYGGNIGALVVDPARAGTAYAAVSGYGVFRTVDGGANWVAVNQGLTGVGLVPLTVGPLAIDPAVTSTVYVGLDQGGLFRSADSGATWLGIGGFDEVGCVAVDPQTPSTIYACTGAGFEKSRDGGLTWQGAISGLPANTYVSSIVVDPSHPNRLYASVNATDHPFFRSIDGGSSWIALGIPPGANYLFGISVDGSSRLFATTDQGIFRSTDFGASWSNVLPDGYFYPVSVVGSDLYAAGDTDPNAQVFPNAALRSTDGGDHWTPLAVPAVPTVFASSPAEPAAIYAGCGAGILESTDDGSHWTASSHGMLAVAARAAMDPANPGLLYAASAGGGLFSSADGGRSWSIADVDSRIAAVAIQPGTLDVFSGAGRSRDGGVTWQPTPVSGSATVPVIAAHAPRVLFAGNASCGLAGYAGQVFQSVDVGATWSIAYDAHLGGCTSPVVSASGRSIFIGVEGFAIRTLVQSRDGGATWNTTDASGLPDNWLFDFNVLAIDPSDENVVYLRASGKLWRSLGGGGQWQEVDAGIPASAVAYLPIVSDLVIDPVSPATLYAATPEGVYRSLDRGASWSAFGDGLPGGRASGLAIDATGRILHVAAGGGIYDIEIGGGCAAGSGSLCLLGGRFVVTAQAIDPRTGRLEVGTALSQTDQWGYFSLPGFTGDSDFPEIVVKMADATSMGEGFWFFHSGLTDLEYTLSVLDTVTGQQKSYQNDRSDPQALCGGADTGTFTGGGAAFASGSSRVSRAVESPALVLLDRFTATLTAIDPRTGREAGSTAVSGDTKWGYFSIPDFTGDPGFPEVFVKMLDATELSGTYWVFHTGLTDLEYTLIVTDMQTGSQRVYRNERGDPSRLCGGADTDAFHD